MHQRLLSFSFSCTVVCPHLLFRFFHSSVMIYSLVYVASICLFPLHISICLGKQTMAILFVAQLSASSHELQIHYWSYNLCYCFVASGKPICSILVPLKEQSVIVYCHRYVYCLLTTAFVAALMSDNSLLTSFKVSPTGSSDHCTQFRIRRCSSLFRLHLISFVQWAELLCVAMARPVSPRQVWQLSIRLARVEAAMHIFLCGAFVAFFLSHTLRALFWCNNTLTPIKSIRFLSKLI